MGLSPPGTLFVALAFVVASMGFNIYITHFSNYPHLYGALAAFIVLMIWIYMACLILLIGAETDNFPVHAASQRALGVARD